MTLFFRFLTFFLALSFTALAQEARVEQGVSIFENEVEELLLTRYQEEPFLLLQSLNPGASLESPIFEKLVNKLHKRASKISSSDKRRLLEEIYFSAHQLILTRYEEHAYFSKTLQEGIYDCVTGSGLYALLLDEFQIEYQIIETDAHVYIKGNLDEDHFLLESTFPTGGLIFGENEVSAFEQKFIRRNQGAGSIPNYLGKTEENGFTESFHTVIGLRELAGLQYYNDAIKKFFEEDYTGTYTQLLKAEFLYPSERIIELKQKITLLLQSHVNESAD
ncbi:hypothetical protein [Mongoliibacter ruber]|uniref:Transglutaminase superfamily protein n=1 Tax=Mongoliibacter ruber TaxID=1750599 RepID=A0A2T0WSG3_9BACT|nr:hypothetical protein [Mongoliibacter ruber]PRY89639.1 hypothetical protein CLW00_102115 [Mongoliibacter ruber]